MEGPVLAVDIGGTKLAAALVAPGGLVSREERVPTPAPASGEEIWQSLSALLDRVAGDAAGDLAGVGCGCGGPMRWPAGEVSPLNIPGWQGFGLRRRLQEQFPGIPVRVHNDALAFAAGEHSRGAGQSPADMLGMVVSTGVGGGLVLGGRLVDGVSGNAGHIGHVVVDPQGPECVCGGRGCLEAVARGPAVAAWARARGWRPGAAASARELAADAGAGDPVAVAALARAGEALGVAIASATVLLDLQLVVVGGGLAQAGRLLFDPLEAALRRHARMGFARGVRVVPAQLGQQAGLIGAAELVLGGDRYWSGD